MTITTEATPSTPSPYRATYSPDDNKLRLYSLARLPSDVYQRLRHAGFRWAPKQDLFVAPMWAPDREDLLIELCGQIEDDDTSLVERAAERAERFEDYSEKRGHESEAARAGVAAIADAIPLGQPILIGHHSEKHARRDIERIKNGMRRAVKLWETSRYWTERAQAAIRHATYKERPDVRQRRIKGLGADLRKQQRTIKEAKQFLDCWQGEGLSRERALAIADHDPIYRNFPLADYPRDPPVSQYEGPMSLWSALDGGVISEVQAREIAIAAHSRMLARSERWIAHYQHRLTYERAMLSAEGGIAADQVKPEKGGACVCWASPRGGWSYIERVNRVSVTVLDNFGNGGSNFTRAIPFDKLSRVMTLAEVQEKRSAGGLVESQDGTGFFLRDSTAQEVTRRPSDTGQVSVPSSSRSFTMEQIREAEEAMMGFCLACGALRDTCEPDAERYTCEDCGADEVYGPHWLVMAGMVR